MPIFRPGPTSEADLARKFKWLARSGIGVPFGTRPIDWYQAHQMCALQVIEEKAIDTLRLQHFTAKDSRNRYASEPFEVRTQAKGFVQVRRLGGGTKDWEAIGGEASLYDAADRCARGGGR